MVRRLTTFPECHQIAAVNKTDNRTGRVRINGALTPAAELAAVTRVGVTPVAELAVARLVAQPV